MGLRNSNLAIRLGLWKEYRAINGVRSKLESGDLCSYCEENIIEGPSVTQFFMCEGCYCTNAEELYLDDELAEIRYNRWYNKTLRWIKKQVESLAVSNICVYLH